MMEWNGWNGMEWLEWLEWLEWNGTTAGRVGPRFRVVGDGTTPLLYDVDAYY